MGFTLQEIPQEEAVKNFRWYAEGIGVGSLPLIGALTTLYLAIYHPALYVPTLGLVILTFYILEIAACMVVLLISRTRMFGYGLLTMLIASSILVFLAGVILWGIHSRLING